MNPQLLAALIGSLPGWAAVAVAIWVQRRAIRRDLSAQTSELKDHITSTAAAGAATEPEHKHDPGEACDHHVSR